MTTEEQIRIQLALESREFNSAMESAEQRVEHFGKEGHKWFEHVGSAGRSFHKVLEQVTDQFPLLGNAIKFINPIVGALGAATAAFAYFKKQLEDWNKEMDEAAAKAAEPWGAGEQAIRSAAAELRKLDSAYKEFKEKLGGETAATIAAQQAAADKSRLQRIADQEEALKRVLERQKEIKEESLKLVNAGAAPTSQDYAEAASRFSFIPGGALLGLKDADKIAQEEYNRKEKKLIDEKAEAKKQEVKLQEELNRLKSEQADKERDLKKAQEEALKDAEYQYNLDLEEHKALQKIEEEWDKLGDKIDEARVKASHIQRDMDRAVQDFQERRAASVTPTIHELATSGKWDPFGIFFEKGQYSEKAQEIEKLEVERKRAIMEDKGGRFSAAYIKASEKQDFLKRQLADAGVQISDHSQEELNKRLSDLLEEAKENGIKIQVPDDGT